MTAVAQLFAQFLAQEPGRANEFLLWLMSRGEFSLETKAACLLLKIEVMKEMADLKADEDFTAEALAQAVAIMRGER